MPAGLHDVLEETNLSGTLTNEYVFFGGKRIARRNDGSYLSSATMQNASLSQANALDQPCTCGPYNLGPIPGWTSGGSGPTGSWQPNTVSYNAPLPGIVVLSNSGTISQTLTTSVQPNTTYTLLVDIGKRLEPGLTADYSLTLQAGSTVLATLRASNGAVPAGSFQTESLVYTSPPSPPAGNITIVLQSYGVQIDFKNVRLNLSSPSTVQYYFADHLGSSRIITTSAGAPCYDADFFPFGGEQAVYLNTCPQNYKFTGKERDGESGLDFMEARYYGSSMGRFMSPDPLGGHLEDPQTLNRYVYVRNNPLRFTDPTGLDFYLTCTQTKDNASTCQGGHQGTTTTDENGKSTFNATVIKNDKNGNLVDQNGNKYSGTFDGKSVSFTQDGSKQSSTGEWKQDSNATAGIQGTGALNNFNFTFMNHNSVQNLYAQWTFNGTQDQASAALEKAGFVHWNLGGHIGKIEYRYPTWGRDSVHFSIGNVTHDPRSNVPQTHGDMHNHEYDPGVHLLNHFWYDVLKRPE